MFSFIGTAASPSRNCQEKERWLSSHGHMGQESREMDLCNLVTSLVTRGQGSFQSTGKSTFQCTTSLREHEEGAITDSEREELPLPFCRWCKTAYRAIQYIWTRNDFLQEQTCEKSRLLSHNHSVYLRKSFHGPSQAFLFPTWLNFVGKQPSWICYLRLSWKETSPFSQFHTIKRFLIKTENDPAQLFNT